MKTRQMTPEVCGICDVTFTPRGPRGYTCIRCGKLRCPACSSWQHAYCPPCHDIVFPPAEMAALAERQARQLRSMSEAELEAIAPALGGGLHGED